VFGISGTELFLIAAFALIIFGPDKLPAMARTVGRVMKEFKRAQDNVESMLRAELYTDEKSEAAPGATTVTAPPPAADQWTAPSFADDVDEEEEEE